MKWVNAATVLNTIYGIIMLLGLVVALFRLRAEASVIVSLFDTVLTLVNVYLWLLVLRAAPDWIGSVTDNRGYPDSAKFQRYLQGLMLTLLLQTLVNVVSIVLHRFTVPAPLFSAVMSVTSTGAFVVLLGASLRFIGHTAHPRPVLSTS